MPTKTRYVLRTREGSVYTGKTAVAILCKAMSRVAMSADMPDDWKGWSTRKKLKFLAARLQKGNTFLIFQEPRWCRKNKSLYLKAIARRDQIDQMADEAFPPGWNAPVQVRAEPRDWADAARAHPGVLAGRAVALEANIPAADPAPPIQEGPGNPELRQPVRRIRRVQDNPQRMGLPPLIFHEEEPW
jgi:hypothetical protein